MDWIVYMALGLLCVSWAEWHQRNESYIKSFISGMVAIICEIQAMIILFRALIIYLGN